jgi:pimeloyl-ACP methyl ester carboxylesterase
MRLLFLPGVSGDGRAFWQPVAARLPAAWDKAFLDWPGLGEVPAAPDVGGFDDLVTRVVARLEAPAVLVAQSMGGVIALRAALRRPDRVPALVLTATSGGLDLAPFGAADWRPDYRARHPQAPAWAYDRGPDLSAALAHLDIPTLLVWATADPISPLAVGRHLERLMPRARLRVIDSDDHWVAQRHAVPVAAAIARHVRAVCVTREAGPRRPRAV